MGASLKLLLSLCLFSSLSFSSYAAPFCQDPVSGICETTEEQREKRRERVQKLKEEISREADANTKIRLENESSSSGGGLFSFGMIGKFLKKWQIQNDEIMKAARKRIGSFEEGIISSGMIDEIKRMLKIEIDNSPINFIQKIQFKAIVDEVVVGNFGDYIDRNNLGGSLFAQFFSNHCGSDGLIDNAFATMSGDDKYVLICPGWLITLNEAPTSTEVFYNVLHVLTHEIAHHMDFREHPEAYSKLSKCYQENHFNKLNKSSQDEEFCSENSKSACAKKVVESHMGEITADLWASKVMANYMRDNSVERTKAEGVIRTAMMKLCGSRDQGVHPSGDFRMEHIITNAPKVLDQLQCRQQVRIYCDLDGAIKK